MDTSQLPLFNQQTESLTEGYNKLAAFRFDEAEAEFEEIKRVFTEPDPEAEQALSCISHWKEVFGKLNPVNSEKNLSLLYEEINRFAFNNTWGFQHFRTALTEYLITSAQQYHVFYILENVTVSDLLLQLNRYEKAEEVLTRQLAASETDTGIRFRLAQIQWRNKQKGEAIRNYALGLLLNPENIPYTFLECDKTIGLIENHGPEMAPAFGWVSGYYPLLAIPENVTPVGDKHGRALACYRLIRQAERASGKNQMDACVNYRKELKEGWPELYQAYYSLLSNRQLPPLSL